MKTLFTIGDIATGSTLLCEIGSDHLCLATADTEGQLQSIRYYDSGTVELLKTESEARAFDKIIIGSSLPEALVIPNKIFDKQKANHWFLSVFPVAKSEVYTAVIPEWQTTVAYTLPEEVTGLFPHAIHAPVYLCDLKSPFHHEDEIRICFSPKYFRVIVKKGNGLQLCQMYPYSTPLDVVYYLLNICYKFDLNQETTHISLSGLIDEDSHLYKELHQYFLDISFDEDMLPIDNTLPVHYFKSTYQLAKCVS